MSRPELPDWAWRELWASRIELERRFADDTDEAWRPAEAEAFVALDEEVSTLRATLLAGFADDDEPDPEGSTNAALAGFAADVEEKAAGLPPRSFGARALGRVAATARGRSGPPLAARSDPPVPTVSPVLLAPRWRPWVASAMLAAILLVVVTSARRPESVVYRWIVGDETPPVNELPWMLAVYRGGALLPSDAPLRVGEDVTLTCQALLRPGESSPELDLRLTGASPSELHLACRDTAEGPVIHVVGPHHVVIGVVGGPTLVRAVAP